MTFSRQRSVKLVLLGTGGTGGHIAPHLYRLLYALDRPVRLILCDGDTVEPNNLIRQNFTQADLGENKARVTAERYSSAFGLETSYVPEFIERPECLEELVRPDRLFTGQYGRDPETGIYGPKAQTELVILIGAVDNQRSRQMCHRVFQRAQELIYIDAGNGAYTGQVVCGVRRCGRTIYQPVGIRHPELFDEADLFPTQRSCGEASVSAPQTIAANLLAAAAVVTMVYNILVLGNSTVEEATFSTRMVSIRAVHKKARKRGSHHERALHPKGDHPAL